jgi:hypothetical protein
MGTVVSITKQRHHNGRVALYISAAVMFIAIAIGVYIYLSANNNNTEIPQPTEKVNSAPVIADNNVTDNTQETTQTESLDNKSEVTDIVEIIEVEQPEDTHPWIERDDIKHYVIYGSYSRKRNAEREASEINNSGLDGVVSKTIIRGKMYSVVIFGSAILEECEAFVVEHKAEFPQAWVYSIEEN